MAAQASDCPTNVYRVGDNLALLRTLPAECVDLVYTDPPYNTGRTFGVDFDDRFESMAAFTVFLEQRLVECHRVLLPTGTLVLHVEPRISHHMRCACDRVFGEGNFVNEIVWQTGGNSKCTKSLQRFHDTLIVYAKRKPKQRFFPLYRPYDAAYKKASNVNVCVDHQKEYITTAIHNSQPDVNPRPNLRYEWQGHHKQWYVCREKMQALHDDHRLAYNTRGVPRVKRFLDEMSGLPTRDVWVDIPNTQGAEKLAYATQKPTALLQRVLRLYTAEGALCVDPFAGSGTLGRAALALGRRYVLLDSNPRGKTVFEESLRLTPAGDATGGFAGLKRRRRSSSSSATGSSSILQ